MSTPRKYEELIRYSEPLTHDEKDKLNSYYEKTVEIIGLHYENQPLILKQLAMWIIRYLWEKIEIDQIEKIMDEWFHSYETSFVSYQSQFELVTDDFDLHKSFALLFIKQKAQ